MVSFAVWWNLWVRCETELDVRDLLSRVDSFRNEFVVVPVSSCDDVWSIACGITALNGMSRLGKTPQEDAEHEAGMKVTFKEWHARWQG